MSTPQQQELLHLEERPVSVEELWQAAQDASNEREREEMAALEDDRWLRDQRGRLERIEVSVTLIVAAAKINPEDPESKSMFTNDVQRKAEVAHRLRENPDYKEAMAALLTAETNQAVRRIHIERLQRDYSLSKLRYAAITLGRKGLGEIEV